MNKYTVRLEIFPGVYKIMKIETPRDDLTLTDLANVIWELSGALSYEVTKDA